MADDTSAAAGWAARQENTQNEKHLWWRRAVSGEKGRDGRGSRGVGCGAALTQHWWGDGIGHVSSSARVRPVCVEIDDPPTMPICAPEPP